MYFKMKKIKKIEIKGVLNLKLQGIHKSYDDLVVIEDLNLTIEENEITCILGPSGCGKSTLLNILANILKPDEGKIHEKKEKIGYVFQEDRLLPWKSVYENIKLVNKNANDLKIRELIEIVGLEGFENATPSKLSGGMRQRVSIARAFNFQAEMLLMDEPFKSLDYDLRLNMVNSLVEIWNKWNNSIVFVTHEIDEALLLGNKIVVLDKNPCTVKEIIKIDKSQHLRSLDSIELVNIRGKLINLLQGNGKKIFKTA